MRNRTRRNQSVTPVERELLAQASASAPLASNPRPQRSASGNGWRGVAGLLVGSAVMLSACGASTTTGATGASTPGSGSTTSTVTVSQAFQSLLYLPLYVAIDKGYFAKNHITVNKVTAGSGASAVASVIGGSAQFSLQDPMIAEMADVKGAAVKPIAAVVSGVPVWIVGKNGKGIPSLRGATVATATPPATATYLLERLLKQQGVSTTLQYVEIGTELAPLTASRVKAAVMYEPEVEQALAGGYHTVYSFAKQYPGDYSFSAIDANASYVKSNPLAIKRFLTGLQQALIYTNSNTAGATAVAMKEFPSLPKAEVTAAVARMIRDHVYASSVLISKSSYNNALALQTYLGNLKAAQVPYATAVDAASAQAAIGSAG